ncbi:MAG: crotonobetainyl-CoA:carnitine CoA-transferase CaiB-like acyl-CoA transferase [Alphaproteobacteria bacterium]|jgi:crotonobetainyl-CoA:carnitine CoA-transferase CaiB-like acyl-CoA transferase
MSDLPLSRFKVLDLTAHRAGPTAVRQLADWGADVIKIERPTKGGVDSMGGKLHGPDYQNLHRNKRSLTLNLKSDEGRGIFMELAKDADVVVENYRSDVKTRLGVDYAAVSAINPRIVYGSISGFGQTGPDATRPGVDQIAQGMGGLMSITGLPGQGPVRVGIAIADLTSGMFLAQAIMMALLQREQTGKGQWVHTSLLESMIFMLDFQAARWTMKSDVAGQAGNDHPTSVPTGVFATSDGYINIAASGGRTWEQCCKAIGKPEMIEDARFVTPALRSENRTALSSEIGDVIKTNTKAYWIEKMTEAGVPTGPINAINETFAEPQVEHLGIATPTTHKDLGTFDIVGQPINMTAAPQPGALKPAPDPGQHTQEILETLGYDADAIAALRERGLI